MNSTDFTPWYREFWAWFVIAILAMGVCSGVGVLAIGLNNPPHMVTGDYQPLGKVLIDTHERADRARELGLSGQMTVHNSELRLTIESQIDRALPDSLLVRLEHPTRSDDDRSVVVQAVSPGSYRGTLSTGMPPRARVILSDLEQTWWLSGRVDEPISDGVDLAPERL